MIAMLHPDMRWGLARADVWRGGRLFSVLADLLEVSEVWKYGDGRHECICVRIAFAVEIGWDWVGIGLRGIRRVRFNYGGGRAVLA